MEFSKYLGKGIWGVADKLLPVIYGLGYVVLVIRVLPEEEFGNFVLVQELFLIVSGLATAFALQPMLKFASETTQDSPDVVGAGLLLHAGIVLAASAAILLARDPLAVLLQSPTLAPLLLFVPLMLAASFVRNFALALLQSQFRIQGIFWADAVHFLGAPLLIWISSRLHLFYSAMDLILINIISLSASSLLGLLLCLPLLKFTLTPRRAVLRQMYDYGKYSFGGIVSYMVYAKADTFILSAFAGPIQVAVYNSAKIFTRIYEMMSQVIQMFVLPAASRLSAQGDHRTLKIVVEKSIAFSTIALFPVLVGFILFASPLVAFLYSGRYTDAVPLLQVFAALSLFVPTIGVATNVLMGLGQARLSFLLSLEILGASIAIYLTVIPWLGPLGAAIGYVLATAVLAWITTVSLQRFVQVTLRAVVWRTNDLWQFIRKRGARLRPSLRHSRKETPT